MIFRPRSLPYLSQTAVEENVEIPIPQTGQEHERGRANSSGRRGKRTPRRSEGIRDTERIRDPCPKERQISFKRETDISSTLAEQTRVNIDLSMAVFAEYSKRAYIYIFSFSPYIFPQLNTHTIDTSAMYWNRGRCPPLLLFVREVGSREDGSGDELGVEE